MSSSDDSRVCGLLARVLHRQTPHVRVAQASNRPEQAIHVIAAAWMCSSRAAREQPTYKMRRCSAAVRATTFSACVQSKIRRRAVLCEDLRSCLRPAAAAAAAGGRYARSASLPVFQRAGLIRIKYWLERGCTDDVTGTRGVPPVSHGVFWCL